MSTAKIRECIIASMLKTETRTAALAQIEAIEHAGRRCLMALAANGAPNCEAAKEMIAALDMQESA